MSPMSLGLLQRFFYQLAYKMIIGNDKGFIHDMKNYCSTPLQRPNGPMNTVKIKFKLIFVLENIRF